MAVDSHHEIYDMLVQTWETVQDCFDGPRGIKGIRAERYLPRLELQTDPEYYDYKRRGVFFNAVRRTVQAMIGFVFRQDPQMEVPDNPPMAEFTHDATLTGKAFYDYAKETVGEVFKTGGRGTLIDWQELSQRVFIIPYSRLDIINWRYEDVNGQSLLTLLVLRESSSQWIRLSDTDKEPDEYSTGKYEQIRVLTLEQDPSGGSYVYVRVFRAKNQQQQTGQPAAGGQYSGGMYYQQQQTINVAQLPEDWVMVDQKVPMRGDKPLPRITFVFHGSEVNELDSMDVPMESIADLNVAHFRNSADYENALHVCGCPTPVFAGFDFSDKAPADKIRLGTKKGIISESSNAHATFLSYNANDASAITGAMDKKEQQMAAQGARILERQTSGRGVEAFQTVQLRQGADTSALMTMTIASTQSLSDVLQWAVWWNDRTIEDPEDLEEDVTYELNTEFIQLVMDSPMLQQLTAAYLQNTISYDTYFTKLQQGGIIGSERTMEEEKAALKTSPTALPGGGVGPDGKPLTGAGQAPDYHDPTVAAAVAAAQAAAGGGKGGAQQQQPPPKKKQAPTPTK